MNNNNNNNAFVMDNPGGLLMDNEEFMWRERERRQRSVRLMMMFLLMLFLMDEEPNRSHLRKKRTLPYLSPDILQARLAQDHHLEYLTRNHSRYHALLEANQNVDQQQVIREFVLSQSNLQIDEFDTPKPKTDDPEVHSKIMHYPWNSSGFYRGTWKRTYNNTGTTTTAPLQLQNETDTSTPTILEAPQLEPQLSQQLGNDTFRVLLLPQHQSIRMRDDNNVTPQSDDLYQNIDSSRKVKLTLPDGRAAFQLFSRNIPGVSEWSLVDGFVKLYDSELLGYSTRKDVLLRVLGVLVHSIGKLSLASSFHTNQVALVMQTNETSRKHTGLPPKHHNVTLPLWSDTVIPFPFVRDDENETIRKFKTPASRPMPVREQALEVNACGFEINMDVAPIEWTVGQWRKLLTHKLDELRQLSSSSSGSSVRTTEEKDKLPSHLRYASRKASAEQALVMSMMGTIHSPNCNFTAFLNTTALRTDWDATTTKAINYSFYMMLVCLTQILVLLRQLLHSQSQSTATRVSLLCIGWQTTIDALLCSSHIYLSLAVQPLFTAFASVAFFKLLIFCVIEMKYMALLLQARNSSNGGQSTEALRRQVAMLHLRFYAVLLLCCIIIYHASEKYRVWYMLLLYSFWVPQIILNVVTEARAPMHKYYIYGMSVTRMVAPLYIFALKNNFLKEVYPESPTDGPMMVKVIVWVGIQTAVLIAQGKYGARFMIPARFLPPKFDYSRPIPASMLPQGALERLPTPELIEDRCDDAVSKKDRPQSDALDSEPHHHHHASETTTRNRYNPKSSRPTSTMQVETMSVTEPANAPALECSICYDPIDVRDREKYMLAPCNHLFHRSCLMQWMDVKMECPICRTGLPAL